MIAIRVMSRAVVALSVGSMLVFEVGCPCICGDTRFYLATRSKHSYGTGDDGDLQKGALPSFTDNGDGTITDHRTGLIWEKKQGLIGNLVNCVDAADCPNPHDARNMYTWSTYDGSFNGTAVSLFLAQLNAGVGFAGHTDWRLPNVNELETLVNYGSLYPAIDAAFNIGCGASCTLTAVNSCSCTASATYWSSTTGANGDSNAWTVDFGYGSVTVIDKENTSFTRACRGGAPSAMPTRAPALRIDPWPAGSGRRAARVLP